MKNILVFSNPFGNGPAGKAISVANFLSSRLKTVNVIVCGSKQITDLVGNSLQTVTLDERDEDAILKLLKVTPGENYVFSSQNRFAVKAARRCNCPAAFLDGLAWFWRQIPEDHFLAETIFWINYEGLSKKIPAPHKNKIHLVGGVTEGCDYPSEKKSKNVLFYLGGCKNPLSARPDSYLDLTATLLKNLLKNNLINSVLTDEKSGEYFNKYPWMLNKVKTLNHTDFLREIKRSPLLITNGGQTAATEAAALKTPIAFFLPMNLSQKALIDKVTVKDKNYPALKWENYTDLTINIDTYSEKDALQYFNDLSKEILSNRKAMNSLRADLQKLISSRPKPPELLTALKSTGTNDIFNVLRKKWQLQ